VRYYCLTLWCFDRVPEGLAIIERAVARDPLDPRTYVLRARLLIAAKRYPDAPGSLQRALELRPKYDGAHRLTGDMLVLTSRPSEALQEYEQMSEGWNRFTGLAIARAGMGDRAGSDRELAELKKIDDGTLNVQFAEVYAQRGEPDQAAAALGAAYSALDGGLNDLLTNPLLEPVRGDSRVQALIKRLHFPT
jgi:tetratricopeptide (TPR) repeat protein